MNLDFKLLPHQYDFVTDVDTPQLLLRGGFYSGKTYAAIYKVIYLAYLNIGYLGMIVEPTEQLLNKHWAPEFEAILDELKIPYDVKRQPLEYILHFPEGSCRILGFSANNHERIVGFNAAFAVVDELDTLKTKTAEAAWKAIGARVRKGRYLQRCAVTTPEGFKFCYKNWITKDSKFKRDIKAKTRDNPDATEEWIEEQMADYTEEQCKAWLDGEFINMTTGQVYYAFHRDHNDTEMTLKDFDDDFKEDTGNDKALHPIIAGIDFNVGKMSAVIHVVEPSEIPGQVDTVYAVAEHLGGRNTESLIETIQQAYPDRHITVYPDSSGKNNKSNSSKTDIALLENAFGKKNVKYKRKNPFVSDRIGSMNQLFKNSLGQRRYLVNSRTCPDYVACLEQQTYTKGGEPDKSNDLDHPIDASGYFIHYEYPLKRNDRKKPVKLHGL